MLTLAILAAYCSAVLFLGAIIAAGNPSSEPSNTNRVTDAN